MGVAVFKLSKRGIKIGKDWIETDGITEVAYTRRKGLPAILIKYEDGRNWVGSFDGEGYRNWVYMEIITHVTDVPIEKRLVTGGEDVGRYRLRLDLKGAFVDEVTFRFKSKEYRDAMSDNLIGRIVEGE